MMRIIITVGVAMILSSLGAAALSWLFGGYLPMAIAMIVSGLVGLHIGNRFAAALEYKPARKPRRTRAKTAVSTGFFERLAKFTGRKPNHGKTQDEFKSNMPFWVADIKFEPTPPRSTQSMRRLLEHIQKVLTGGLR